MSYYDGKCGSCANFVDRHGDPFDPRWAYPAKGYCTEYKTYYVPEESCSSRYRPRSYITTTVCKKLGLDNTDKVYSTIVGFQKNVMEKDKRYEGILREYDAVGPKIARELENENAEVIQKIYDICLTPVSTLLNKNESDRAIYRYRHMIEILNGQYNISTKEATNTKQVAPIGKMIVLSKKNI